MLAPAQFNILMSRYNSDAQDYFDAITDTGVTLTNAQLVAFNNFTLQCKSSGIWDKFTALYPFIGGTAAAHAINAKSPGTIYLTFYGTVYHTDLGMRGDGSTGIAKFSPGYGSANKYSYGLYCDKVPTAHNQALMGRYRSNYSAYISRYYSSLQFRHGISVPSINADSADPGFLLCNRESASLLNGYINGVPVCEDTTENTYFPEYPIALDGMDKGGASANLFDANIAFAYLMVDDSLSGSQVQSFTSAVQLLEVSLGRDFT